MLLSFIWHKLLLLFVSVSVSSRVPHCIPSAWHLADTQQVLLDWIKSVKLRASTEAAPCHPGEGSRKYREELLEEGGLVSFSAGRAAQRGSECLLCGACSGSSSVLLKGACPACQGWPGHLEGPFQPDIHVCGLFSLVCGSFSTADRAFTPRWH